MSSKTSGALDFSDYSKNLSHWFETHGSEALNYFYLPQQWEDQNNDHSAGVYSINVDSTSNVFLSAF